MTVRYSPRCWGAHPRRRRAVGTAGGPEKCRYVVDELGFDACIDYKAHADTKSLYAAMKQATRMIGGR